jgi:hypothetical protein
MAGDYTSWHVGMKVVCVEATPLPGSEWLYGDGVVVGTVYTVARICVDRTNTTIIQLLERPRSPEAMMEFGPNCGYAAWRFRPVQTRKTDISIFTAMLRPIDAKLKETV